MAPDLDHLTMLDKPKLDKEQCPKCHSPHSPGSRECPHCGVIFEKIKSSMEAAPTVSSETRQPTTARQSVSHDTASHQIKKFAIALIFIAVMLLGSGYVYYCHIESRIHAARFESMIKTYSTEKISETHAGIESTGEAPFRTGRVMVVQPGRLVTMADAATGQPLTMTQYAKIHPVWFKLHRDIRAHDPEAVDTLIRIHLEIGKTGRYGKMKTKVYNTHKIVLDVYDWPGRKYIGTKVFDPGDDSVFMTDKDYDAMAELVEDEVIAEYIESMDIWEWE